MNFFHQSIDTLIGLFLFLISIGMFIFPPKFGNAYFGVSTHWTLRNEIIWSAGQKLFALAILIIGSIFFVIGFFNLRKDIPGFSMVILFIILWSLSKYLVHKILERKFSGR